MALSDAYATAVEYRAAIGMSDTTQDAAILKDLKAISRYIDGKVGRFFTKDAQDVTRHYPVKATGPQLWVDDLSAAPTSIKTGYAAGSYETTLAATDYELWPLNAAAEPEPRPFTLIKLSASGTLGCFAGGDRVQIVGKFGWPAVPEAVRRATIDLAGILRLETARATRRIPELGDIIEASPDAVHIVRQLLDIYKRERYA